ncbi:hypothetical protein C1S70_19540 [Azospirillum argentinense]|uniref:Uncharacterized protein n=1 Tax=Azospirillum argentinense TaxID=2970906 RepID=A0A2K1FXM6_9PROT|nr:hypothetical protein [Azospirillum argentinense]PNQ97303.1 hypothetical protein C1S70_19540 [Azospirillum argentinense]
MAPDKPIAAPGFPAGHHAAHHAEVRMPQWTPPGCLTIASAIAEIGREVFGLEWDDDAERMRKAPAKPARKAIPSPSSIRQPKYYIGGRSATYAQALAAADAEFKKKAAEYHAALGDFEAATKRFGTKTRKVQELLAERLWRGSAVLLRSNRWGRLVEVETDKLMSEAVQAELFRFPPRQDALWLIRMPEASIADGGATRPEPTYTTILLEIVEQIRGEIGNDPEPSRWTRDAIEARAMELQPGLSARDTSAVATMLLPDSTRDKGRTGCHQKRKANSVR